MIVVSPVAGLCFRVSVRPNNEEGLEQSQMKVDLSSVPTAVLSLWFVSYMPAHLLDLLQFVLREMYCGIDHKP